MTPRDPDQRDATAPAPDAPILRAALFLDLAGVLLDTAPGSSPRHAQLRPQLRDQALSRLPGLRGGVGAALRLLERLDYRIIVLAPCTLDRRQAGRMLPDRVADLLARERVELAGCYCCATAHAPCPACPPSPALLLRAAREHDLALPASWLLARDVHHLAAGQRAGCRTLQIGTDGAGAGADADAGADKAWAPALAVGADGPAAYQARDIVDAALAIVQLDGKR